MAWWYLVYVIKHILLNIYYMMATYACVII